VIESDDLNNDNIAEKDFCKTQRKTQSVSTDSLNINIVLLN